MINYKKTSFGLWQVFVNDKDELLFKHWDYYNNPREYFFKDLEQEISSFNFSGKNTKGKFAEYLINLQLPEKYEKRVINKFNEILKKDKKEKSLEEEEYNKKLKLVIKNET